MYETSGGRWKDLKADLGYRLPQGHRTWRRLLSRLKASGLVEVLDAKVEEKVVSCIRLLKPFDAKAFSGRVSGLENEEIELDQQPKGVKRGQVTELSAELSIDRQIYDIIEQEGSDGLTVTEIWKRLGLNNKRNYYRLTEMIAKGRIRLEAENHKRSTLYRVKATSCIDLLKRGQSSSTTEVEQNNSRVPTMLPVEALKEEQISASEEYMGKVSTSTVQPLEGMEGEQISASKQYLGEALSTIHSYSRNLIGNTEKQKSLPDLNLPNLYDMRMKKIGANSGRMRLRAGNSNNSDSNEPGSVNRSGLEMVPHEDQQGEHASKEKQPLIFPSPVSVGRLPAFNASPPAFVKTGQRYVPLSTAHAQRAMWIMERLKIEKFILRSELHKWIGDLEGRKDTTLDRKTVIRNLQKLQREGRCKCVLVSIPGVKNCGRHRNTQVVLLPSIEIGPELLSQVYERQRALDMQSRGQGLPRFKKPSDIVPVLTGLKRMIQEDSRTCSQEADKGGSLIGNGFVTAKMVRARMLHQFLWAWVSGTSDCGTYLPLLDHTEYDTSQCGGRQSNGCKIFSLTAAVQVMPLELFLQVIGSSKYIKGLAECCRRGICLNDLPVEESEALLDANASGRLSWLVDILRRLKLLRLVMLPSFVGNKSSEVPQASLAYALEETPYIEEPASESPASLSTSVFNLGPRACHDFHFSTKESLDLYWQTLEFFFSGAEIQNASRAFPGFTVPELFGSRSWTSLRVMSMNQRTELMERIGTDDKRLTYKECVQIAQDLNLRLEQVLRFSYEKNQRVQTKAMHQELEKASETTCIDIPLVSGNFKNVPSKRGSSSAEGGGASSSLRIQKRQCLVLQDAEHDSERISNPDREDDHHVDHDEDEDDSEAGIINHVSVVRTLHPLRARKFLWSDSSDRILVTCYTKQRAILGARYNRVDWSSIPGLPASPQACRRRIALLKMDPTIRRALMKLCTLLGSRYLKHLQSQLREDNNTMGAVKGNFKSLTCPKEGESKTSFSYCKLPIGSEAGNYWDNFEDPLVAAAVDEIIRCKNAARSNSSKKMTGSFQSVPMTRLPASSCSGLPEYSVNGSSQNTAAEGTVSSVGSLSGENLQIMETVFSSGTKSDPYLKGAQMTTRTNTGNGRLRGSRSRRKQLQRPAQLRCINTEELLMKSVGVANTVELIKLVFLNSSSDSEVPKVLVDALHCCKESDVFAAFKYLKEKDLVALGHDSQAFMLSSKFYHNASGSCFPHTTSEESIQLQTWINKNNVHLEQDWVTLKPEQRCGELFHLFALVSSGELSLDALMPEEGVGESKDQGDLHRKRKMDKHREGEEVRAVKSKFAAGQEEGGFGLRRERGFPGVQVRAHRKAFPIVKLLDMCSGDDKRNVCLPDEHATSCQPVQNTGVDECVKECTLTASFVPYLEGSRVAEDQRKILETSSLRVIYDAVVNAGEEGLREDQLVKGTTVSEGVSPVEFRDADVDSLQSFGLVKKVMGYDHVQVIAHPYYERFFLHLPDSNAKTTALETKKSHKDPGSVETDHSCGLSDEIQTCSPVARKPDYVDGSDNNAEAQIKQNANNCKNLVCSVSSNREQKHSGVIWSGATTDEIEMVPILPWLKADGRDNVGFRKKLTQKIMGIVMQNPGILEDDLIAQLDVLNPMSGRKFLQLLELDGHLHVRVRMEQRMVPLPFLLQGLIQDETEERKFNFKRHYYANMFSTSLL